MVYFDCIIVFDDPSVSKLLVDFILPQSMLYIFIFYLISPAVVKVVDFASYLLACVDIKCLVHFRKAPLTQYRQNEVSIIEQSKCFSPADTAILRLLFVSYAFVLQQQLALLFLEHIKLLPNPAFFVFK